MQARNEDPETDYLLHFQRAMSKLYEKIWSWFSCGTRRERGRAGMKSRSFFHSACGGKRSIGFALGIEK